MHRAVPCIRITEAPSDTPPGATAAATRTETPGTTRPTAKRTAGPSP